MPTRRDIDWGCKALVTTVAELMDEGSIEVPEDVIMALSSCIEQLFPVYKTGNRQWSLFKANLKHVRNIPNRRVQMLEDLVKQSRSAVNDYTKLERIYLRQVDTIQRLRAEKGELEKQLKNLSPMTTRRLWKS